MSDQWPSPDKVLDTGPEGCGDLIMTLMRAMRELNPGQILSVTSYDPGAAEDIPAWCRLRGHALLAVEDVAGEPSRRYIIRKGETG